MALLGKNTTDKRPVFLNLFQIHLPVTALVSILHRVSGVGIILGLPVMLYIMYATLAGHAEYILMSSLASSFLGKITLLLIVIGSMYHMLAGARHSYDDFTGSHALSTAQRSAKVLLVIWGIWIGLTIWRLWF